MEDNLNQNIHRPATIATETNPVNDKYHGVTEFNICSLNIQGLKKYENDQKFIQFCKQYDIIGLNETWQRNKLDFESFLEGYVNFDCMRQLKGSSQTWVRGRNCVCQRLSCRWKYYKTCL